MESIVESDESLISTQPIPPKYQTNMAIRLEEEKKGKASAETFEPHQVKKNKMKKTNKKAFEGSLKEISKETIITIDERNNAEEEHPYISRKKVDRTRKNKPGISPKS